MQYVIYSTKYSEIKGNIDLHKSNPYDTFCIGIGDSGTLLPCDSFNNLFPSLTLCCCKYRIISACFSKISST